MSDAADDLNARYVRGQYLDSHATWRMKAQWRVEAFFWYALYWDRFAAMDIDTASDKGAKLFRWLGPRLGGGANRTARRNLKMAFPDWSDTQVEETLSATWENFGRIAGELPHLHEMDEAGDNPRITIVGEDNIRPFIESGQPMVYISGHMANWEVTIGAVIRRSPDAEITYRSLNNPHIDRCIARARAATGVQNFAPKGIGTRELMRALSKGRSVALMNDQKFNEGLSVPLFGHNAMTAPGPTRLALKYKAPLVMFSTRRTSPGRYEITIHPPHWPDRDLPQDESILKSVAFINDWLADCIREAPSEWFWQHNRWPKEAWVEAGVM